MTRRIVLLLLLSSVLSCSEVTTEIPDNTIPTGPTSPTAADRIEFRVVGFGLSTFNPVLIRHSDPINGITLYSGGVPYFAAINSRDESIFLFLEASAVGLTVNSTIHLQIFVNGRLFREAFAQGLNLQTQTSGTYRR